MTPRIRIRRPLALLLATATLVLAALLIWQCIDIYLVGTSPQNLTAEGVRIHDIYSREIVAQRFARILWAVWAWLAALAAAVIERALRPMSAPDKPGMPLRYRLTLLKARAEMTAAMRREERVRRLIWGAAALVCSLCAAMTLAYLLDGESFASRDLEPVMARMTARVAPWVAAAFAVLMLAAECANRSLLREIEAAKTAPKRAVAPQLAAGKTPVNVIRLALGIAALALIALGIINGGMWDVLVKAINICTECVGLG